MTKEALIQEIHTAFKDVTLDDGIGLWEGQGVDDYADAKTMADLRRKDERNNWDNMSYKGLEYCHSSLSFFDAKGMRFCLPKFLIFDILEEQLYKEQGVTPPDVTFTLGYNLHEEYQQTRFSLLNNPQIQSIIHFLEYKVQQVVAKYKAYSADYSSNMDAIYSDSEYVELNKTLNEWKQKLN